MTLDGNEKFVSIDIESTGQCPGLFSMIDLGCSVVGDIENTFSASLKELPGATRSAKTMQWWMANDHKRRVFSQIQERAEEPGIVMHRFKDWLCQFANPVLIGFPIAWDFQWPYWYWWKFIGSEPPFGHRGVDGKTLAAIVLKCEYKKAGKRLMKRKLPQAFRNDLPHSHFAVEDSQEQAWLFQKLMELL